MIDILIGIFFFGLLILSIIGLIVLIPVWIKVSTESEKDPNHIYNIFWEEAGFRGHKIISASGILFPFIILARPVFELEGVIICAAISVACGFYHSSVYRDYPVLTLKMKIAGIVALIILSIVSLLERIDVISGYILAYLVIFTGTAWGGYAVYRRSQLIRITRLSN